MSYLLGIDLGTSGTKAVLFDTYGVKVASHTIEYDFKQPKIGWAEQSPNLWWEAAIGSIKVVLRKSGIDPTDIDGVGIAGQMHGLVMLDKDGELLRDAILWCDGRTGKQCAEIEKLAGRERLVSVTGNPALPGFTAGKILWVRENEPEIYEKCRWILMPKDYVRYRLTGVVGQEVSDASGTNLLDIHTRCWSDEIIGLLGLEREMFPEVRESISSGGAITEEAARLTGLCPGTPVCMGAGDNAAGAVGTGVVEAGKAFTTIGTSGVIFAYADKIAIDRLSRVHTFCHAVPDAWAVMSCTLCAGMSFKWFRDRFCRTEMEVSDFLGISPYELMSDIASRVPAGCEGLIFLPYLMGERSPILDEKAKGAFVGLSTTHGRAHMIRAVMEGVMYSQRQCLDVIHEMGIYPDTMYACGGGAKSELWRGMMADLYNTPIYTLSSDEGPALGAAILAAVCGGVYKTVEAACSNMVKSKGMTCPQNPMKYEPYYRIYSKLYTSLKNCFSEISFLQ